MPYQISKLSNGKYQVKNKKTGEIKAKSTTHLRAKRQVQFLNLASCCSKCKNK